MGGTQELSGPDLGVGVTLAELPEGKPIVGHYEGEAVLLVRRDENIQAVGARCSHYGAPLADGLVVGDTVRCPWHHACFSLATGEALGAPALAALPCYQVASEGGVVRLTGKRPSPSPSPRRGGPERIVIVGAGGAGNAAAEMLRRLGFAGSLTMVGDEPDGPYDRPNLSKDYLAGTAPEEWIPLRGRDFYAEQGIELVTGCAAAALDVAGRRLTLADGRALGWDRLLLCTGAEPVHLATPGADLAHVHVVRSLADSRRLIAAATTARRAVVVGASFIGLEVAAALRGRGLDVVVVGPEARPLERVLGREVGGFVQGLHEERGVGFRLGATVARIEADAVVLSTGQRLPADLVVVGVGVRPRVALAEAAGLAVDRGVVVDARLATSAADVFAAGDVARVSDAATGTSRRIEHWVFAERMGQHAARTMLGDPAPLRDVPFFWSAHYDAVLAYVGHAEAWDRVSIVGSLTKRDAAVAYRAGDRTLALLTIGRDLDSLIAERAFERGDQATLTALTAP